jgi:hypothetical protein
VSNLADVGSTELVLVHMLCLLVLLAWVHIQAVRAVGWREHPWTMMIDPSLTAKLMTTLDGLALLSRHLSTAVHTGVMLGEARCTLARQQQGMQAPTCFCMVQHPRPCN